MSMKLGGTTGRQARPFAGAGGSPFVGVRGRHTEGDRVTTSELGTRPYGETDSYSSGPPSDRLPPQDVGAEQSLDDLLA